MTGGSNGGLSRDEVWGGQVGDLVRVEMGIKGEDQDGIGISASSTV